MASLLFLRENIMCCYEQYIIYKEDKYMNIAGTLQGKLDDVYYDNFMSSRKRDKAKAVIAATTCGAIDGLLLSSPFMLCSLLYIICHITKKCK